MRLRILTAILLLLCVTISLAQAPPAPVPRDKAAATYKGNAITIEYGRPVLKGRSFEDLAKKLPEDRMWRAGSGLVTILDTAVPLKIAGKKIPAGKYSLYVYCPVQGDYALAINKDLGQPLSKIFAKAPAVHANDPYPHFTAYQKEIGDQEIARAPLKKASLPATDIFTIALKPSKKGALMEMSWGDRSWTLEMQAGK
jgi:hypothetical protein